MGLSPELAGAGDLALMESKAKHQISSGGVGPDKLQIVQDAHEATREALETAVDAKQLNM